MPNAVFGFAPPDYGDWASYAGFDRKTGEQTPYQAPTGVAPPENIGDYANQRISGIANKFDDLQSKFKKAINPMMGKSTGSNSPAPSDSGFDFSESPIDAILG